MTKQKPRNFGKNIRIPSTKDCEMFIGKQTQLKKYIRQMLHGEKKFCPQFLTYVFDRYAAKKIGNNAIRDKDGFLDIRIGTDKSYKHLPQFQINTRNKGYVAVSYKNSCKLIPTDKTAQDKFAESCRYAIYTIEGKYRQARAECSKENEVHHAGQYSFSIIKNMFADKLIQHKIITDINKIEFKDKHNGEGCEFADGKYARWFVIFHDRYCDLEIVSIQTHKHIHN